MSDEDIKFMRMVAPYDEQIVWARNVLYKWNVGFTCWWLFVIELLLVVGFFTEWSCPRWIMITLSILAGKSFLGSRGWAPGPNLLGFLNIFVWMFQICFMAVIAPVMGPLWIVGVMFCGEIGKFVAATDIIMEVRKIKGCAI